MEDIGLLEQVSKIKELNGTKEFLDDEDVNKALMRVVKIIAKPEIPPAVAMPLIVELQALATKFAIQATYYMTIGKGETQAVEKKNMYFTLREYISKLADALKYLIK